jgi:hypothetical protein
MSGQPNLGQLSREQLTNSFQESYTLAPYYMSILGCKGEALDALQSDLETDGWAVLEKQPDDNLELKTARRLRLRPASDESSDTLVSCEDVSALKILFDGCLNPECELSEAEVTNLAIRHKVLMTIGYYFPISLMKASASEHEKKDAVNKFYSELHQELPEKIRNTSLTGSDTSHELVGRFAHGFALIGLLDYLERHNDGAINGEVARRGLARIIDNARVHPNPHLRSLGIPIGPKVIKTVVSKTSSRRNNANN